MNFSDYYYEATIQHTRPREVLARPTVVEMPRELKGKRLFTMVNSDNVYFTYVFDPMAKEPLGVYMGDHSNVFKAPMPAPQNALNDSFNKLYRAQAYDAKPADPSKYGGEVRIHPPVKGYVEHPQDAKAYFFDDFGNKDAVYQAGATIADPMNLIKKKEED